MSYISQKQCDHILEGILGKEAWNFQFSREGFLTVEFGGIPAKHLNEGSPLVHGDWHLWIYSAPWQMTRAGELLVNSDTEPEVGRKRVSELNGSTAEVFVYYGMERRLLVKFGEYVELEVIGLKDGEDDQWMLFLPNDCVLTAGSDGRCVLEQE